MDENAETIELPASDYVDLTAGIVAAYMSNNHVRMADIPALIATTHAALAGLGRGGEPAPASIEKPTPAQIRKSITHEAIVSFEDGKGYKTLRRHLNLRGLTPEAYRQKWGLPRDYPVTAASYSEKRSALAKSLGLGQQRRKRTAPAPAPEPVAKAPKRTNRPRKAKGTAEA